MSNTIRIKRSTSTETPTSLENAEIAYSELSDKLFIGVGTGGAGGSATTIVPIGGAGYFLTKTLAASTYQTQAGMTSYLTTSTASSTYAPLASPTFTGTVTIPSGASISGYATTASLSSYAPLASPTFTGVPAAPTASANTNTTQVATTAFVLGQGNSTAATIAMNGSQAAGTSNLYARADHIHPTDTSRAPLASPTFTGTPLAPTAVADTNTTQIATTAYVVGQGYLKSATASSTYAPLASPTFTGTVTIPAGASISGFAPLASPTFTGTPAVPTATAGTNTTQAASTAFVQTAVSNLVGGATAALDTLNELATALGNDANFATTISTSIGTKLAKASNLSDLADAATARTNLGLGTMATATATDYLSKAGNLSGLASTSTARTNLGLGSMATQSASAVAITGGTIDGVTIDGGTF
jgi:hypothetical protein